VAKVDYFVLAPLQIELEAILEQFRRIGADVQQDGERDEWNVELGRDSGNEIRVVIKKLDRSGRVAAAMATLEAVTRLEPRAMLVAGIAGGIDGRTALGDVLVADQIVDASNRRVLEGGDRVQAQVYRTSRRLLAAARQLDLSWVRRISSQTPADVPSAPKVYFGPIACTDSIVSRDDYLAPLRDTFTGLLGVERESGGVAEALETRSPKTEFLVIRCVVDQVNMKGAGDWRMHGAETVAAFLVWLVQVEHRLHKTEPATHRPPAPPPAAVDPPTPPSGPPSAPSAPTTPQLDPPAAPFDPSTPPFDPSAPPTPPSTPPDPMPPPSTGPQASGSGTRLVRDAAGERPCLNADEYASALADALANASGEICFALLGHWGRGKTYLARLVDRKLPDSYDRIWFSAWKYRSRPELWAHLHESFYEALMRSPWWRRVPRIFRANLHKYGIGPLLMMFIGAGIAAIPIGSLVGAAVVALGVIGAIRGALLYFKQRMPVARTLNRFLRVNRHIEKLGLQAAIGVDLESMVVGWAGRRPWRGAKPFLVLAGYAVSLGVLLGGLWLGFHGEPLRILGVKLLDLYPSSTGFWTFLIVIGVLAVVLPMWLLGFGRDKHRLLLIIDDLDRMPSSEMLEVIESLKLFLENGVVREVIQLLMICEEDSLRRALANKYGDLAHAVEENLQKLFIAHLRLPPLGRGEQEEVLTYIIDAIADPSGPATDAAPTGGPVTQPVARAVTASREAEAPSAISQETPAPSAVSHAPATPSGASPKTPAARPPVVEFTDDDRRALRRGLGILGGPSSTWATLGPRAIQSYVLRYKLARRLLEARGAEVHPEGLAASLATRMHRGSWATEHAAGTPLDEVIAEVA